MTQITKAALLDRVEALEKSSKRETALRKREATERKRLEKTLAESLEQQTATSEILRVISESPTGVQPVFEAIADSAMRLFGAWGVLVWRSDGELVRLAAARGGVPGTEAMLAEWRNPWRAEAGSPLDRSLRSRAMQQIVDAETDESVGPIFREAARERGARSAIWMPMLRGDEVVGVISVSRARPGPFAPAEIAMLQTFADQAVIAIENVRLFTELQASNRELTTALEQQTATAEVLRVISQSQTDVQPVFTAILECAVRLCEADMGGICRVEGGQLVAVECQPSTPEFWAALRESYPRPVDTTSLTGRAAAEGRVVHVPDVEDPAAPASLTRVTKGAGFRSQLSVPLLRGGEPLGVLALQRRAAGPFSDSQIELVQTFADQAVIAIENARLIGELETRNADLTQSLDRQTATAEILRVISSSPTDLHPVMDAIAENAGRVCAAADAVIYRVEGDSLRIVAARGSIPHPPIGEGFQAIARDWVTGRAVVDRRTVHVPDLANASEDEFAVGREIARRLGHRTTLATPLLREGVPLGAILIRRTEVRPFSDKQIELLQTFADQAVIAIENVRLFTELQASNRELTTALDTQTATADILRVISRSQTDVQPVFDAIVVSAARLLGANAGVLTRIEGDVIELAALTSTNDSGDAATRSAFPLPLRSEWPLVHAIRDRVPINVLDAHTDPRWPEAVRVYARVRGYRSTVVVPLLRHDEAIGTIAVTRREPGGFTDDEIALLKTFADQAVIAIENARLLSELQTRTHELTRSVEQLTALGDVGRAVSSSLDLDTVLTTIVGRAVQLSGADGGTIFEYDEGTEEFAPRATSIRTRVSPPCSARRDSVAAKAPSARWR